MFSSRQIIKSTGSYLEQINKLKSELASADAVVIGAGAGLSTSAGFTYSGERFQKYFSDFASKYHFADMYSGGFYPYDSLEEYWAYWSRYIFINRYVEAPKPVYNVLFNMVKDKDYFMLTTNVDHQFQKSGFDKHRLFYTQGDYGLWQCMDGCGKKTSIPSGLIPYCPECGKPLTMNLRCDDSFVQDEGWDMATHRYSNFLHLHENGHVLYLELGVGANTPVIVKYHFWD